MSHEEWAKFYSAIKAKPVKVEVEEAPAEIMQSYTGSIQDMLIQRLAAKKGKK